MKFKKKLLFLIFFVLLIIIVIFIFLSKNKKQEINSLSPTAKNKEVNSSNLITYYGQVNKISTSGEARFWIYDIKLQKTKDSMYDWFWAMPKDIPGNQELTDKWIDFIQKNKHSVFKITGIKIQDDCDYYDLNHCIEDINVKKIEVISKNSSMSFENY